MITTIKFRVSYFLMTMFFLVASNAGAETLRYTMGYPPNTTAAIAAETYARYLEEVSGGELKAKVFAGSLLSFAETPSGIAHGMADSGLLFLSYSLAEFPYSNMVAELTMMLETTGVSPDKAGVAYAGAMSEFIISDCPECIDEFSAQNQLFLGGGSSPPYWMLCTSPVTSLEHMQGRRLRAGGAQWSRWAEAMGATPITVSAAETYEALNQGVIDCTMIPTTDLTVWKLDEVVTDITVQVPGGVYGASAVNNTNLDIWRRLSVEQREALVKASAKISAEMTWGYVKEGMDNLAAARVSGDIQVHEPDDELLSRALAFIAEDVETVAANYEKRFGIHNARERIDRFEELLVRWSALVEDVNNVDELVDLYWAEAFSKIDVESYGLK